MTAIVKQADGTYKARPIIDGKKLTVRARTKREAEEQIAQLKKRQRLNTLGLPDPDQRPEDLTYDDLCDRVLAQYPHRPQSKRALEENLARSRAAFGRVLVRELLPKNIGAWLHTLTDAKDEPLKATTKRNTLKAMRQVLHRAVEWGYLNSNPASKVEMPKEPEYDARPFDSWAEVRKVSAAMKSPRNQALVLFACATGLRPQEWRALQWRDIDVAGRTLRVMRTIQDGKLVEQQAKTRGSLRTVMLTDEALEALRLLATPLRRDSLVFPGRDGVTVLDPHAWQRKAWTNALAAAGVTYREVYAMRDTYATLNLNDGAPLEWISKQMGHSDVSTTIKHYARWQPATDFHIVDQLNKTRAAATGLKTDSATAAES
jgi:integrase